MSSVYSTKSALRILPVVALGLTANALFTGEPLTRFNDTASDVWLARHAWGAVALALAIGFAVWSFGPQDNYPASVGAVRSDSGRSRRGRVWRFLPAIACYLAAGGLYAFQGETNYVRWLWILSVVLLLVPLWRDGKWADFWPLALWEYLLLLAIVGAAFVLRYVDLTEVPFQVDNDVSIMALFSRRLIESHDWRWVGMAPTDHHFSEHQYLALSMRLFGTDHYGLTMLSVLAGSATCVLVFYFGRIFFNRWVGLLAAAFLASNYVHIHFSRIIFGPISTFFVVLGGLFLVQGLRSARLLSFALGGASMGAGLLGYYSARIGPVIFLALFAVWWFQRKRDPRVPLGHWLVALAGIVFVFGPNLVYSLVEFDRYSGRGNEVVLWTDNAWNHLSEKYRSDGSASVVIEEQVKRTLLAPFFYPDESTICHLRKPMLGALTALSFIAGLGFCFRRFFDLTTLYLLLLVGVTFVFGGILTIDPPFWPHLNIALPGMALVAAIGLERIASRAIQAWGTRARLIVPVGLAAAVSFSGLHDWEVYYRFARDHGSQRIHAMRQIRALPPDHRVYLVSDDTKWEQETFQFFTPLRDGRNLAAKDLLAEIPPIEKPTVFFIFDGVDPGCLDAVSRAFPYARKQAFWDGWGWPIFTRVDVYPPGYVAGPLIRRAPAGFLWSMPGWRILFLVGIVALYLGAILVLRVLTGEPSRTG